MNEVTFPPNFQTKRVSIYQNGIAFFYKNGQVDASTGRAELGKLPAETSAQEGKTILFGTFRFFSPANPLLRITVLSEGEETQVASTTLAEILSHNLDKTVQLTLKNDPLSHSGKIASLQDGTLLLKMDKGWKQIALEAIDYLDFTEDPDLFYQKTIQKTSLLLDFEQRQQAVPLELVYFRKGLIWVPNYHAELLGDQKARLSLRANVFNDAEDLNGVAVDFIMGIPSFANIRDPLFSGQSQEDFLDDLESPPHFRTSRHSFVVEDRVGNIISRQEPKDDPDAAGSLNDEDQFLYTAGNLHLPKGGRMLIHLLDTDISYEDHYSTQLGASPNRLGRFVPNQNGKKNSNKTWHYLKFKNEAGLPLPTGSVSFMKNENGEVSPISQNELNFVPADVWASVKMTQVPDIAVFDQETCTLLKQDNQHLATVEAVIEASNLKKKEITLEIKRVIVGELLESDFPWTKSSSKGENDRNQTNEVSWLLTLKPGEQRKITYGYRIYLSN